MPLHPVKDLVVRKFGKSISSHYDAIQLQEAILKASGKRLSTQTIKRFFGLIKSSSKPDPATLDALASYLHFSSFADLENWLTLTDQSATEQDHDWASEIVLQILHDIHPENLHEQGLLQLVKNLFTLFERHPGLTSNIYPKLAASRFGRRYFFEQFVHYDALAAHYGMGIEHYMLHETEREHRAFGYSILCLRNYLTGKLDACRYYGSKLLEYSKEEIEKYHPFVIGRYYSTKLYVATSFSSATPEFADELMNEVLAVKKRCTDIYDGFPCTEMVFAEALIFTRHYSEAYKLLSHKQVSHYQHPPYMDQAFKNHLGVLRTFTGVYSGNIANEKAARQLTVLEERPAYFLCTNYTQLFLHLTKMKAGLQPRINRKKAQECLDALGFTNLAFFFE
jgi:hypothetical protein